MNKIQIIVFIILLLTSTSFSANSQTSESYPFNEDIIKIDPTTRKPEKSIPFDKPFSLLLAPKKIEDIVSIYAYKIQLEKNNRKTIRNINDTLPLSGISYRIIEKQLIIDFPPMKANEHFDFCIIRKFSGDTLKQLLRFIDSLAKIKVDSGTVDKASLDSSYKVFKPYLEKEVYKNNRTSFKLDYLFDEDSLTEKDRILQYWFLTDSVFKYYSNIFNYNFSLPINDSIIPELIYSAVKFKEYKESDIAINLLYKIIKAAKLQNLGTGLISIKNGYTEKKLGKYAFEERIANLDSTISHLILLSSISERLFLSLGASDSSIQKFSSVVKATIEKCIINRKIIATNYTGLAEYVRNDYNLRYTEWYINTSDFRDLQTKSSFLFSPQIGISELVVRNNENKIKTIPKILLGINIYFKPIDKNQKLKYIENKSIFNYLSLSVALTLGKFDDAEFDNLYGSNSLLVGPSLRFSRSLYVSTGISIFKQLNQNPIINKKERGIGGYFSLMLDLDITQAISSFRNILFK